MGCAVDYLTTSVIVSRLYQVWGDLTDQFELKPEERAEALNAMKQAAGEWIAARDDAAARASYLDRWQERSL